MLVSANALDAASGPTGIAARARRATQKAGLHRESRLMNGLGISPLRATGGPPGVLSAAASDSETQSALVKPPASGQGLMSQLQAQVQSVSPLTGSLAEGGPRSLGVLQASLVKAREDFARIDSGSRLLQVAASPFRDSGGFGSRLFSTSLDLLA